MRKTLTTILATCLVFGAFAAPSAEAAKKKKPKVMKFELPYGGPAIGTAGAGGCSGCPSFSTPSHQSYATISVADDTFPTAHVSFSWDTNGDGVSDTGFVVCGATTESVAVPPSTTVNVFPWALPGPDCPTGASSSGTIAIELSPTA